MKTELIQAAVAEAKRFIERAELLLAAIAYEEESARIRQDLLWHGCVFLPTLPKERGAVRRSSLDLTRALAEMRKAQA